MNHQTVLVYRILGFLSSLLLSVAAFGVILAPEYLNLSIEEAITVILIFAVVQAVCQYIFFLHLRGEEKGGAGWNLGVFFSTISIIFIVIFFSIWIMAHLNYNMMPVDTMSIKKL